MIGKPTLDGCSILVVEDDYYLATDTARALESAGAHVIGPCATVATAVHQIAHRTPTGAVLDINLGDGASFDVAHLLHQRGVPFFFLSGYDEEIIPSIFADVPRLQKPVEVRDIVAAVVSLLRV